MRRRALAALALSAALGLSACAALTGPAMLSAEVASWGEWPADRKPGTYAFERLPSQQTRAQAQAQLEGAAAHALAAAGFRPAEEGTPAEFVVQLGARATRWDASPWLDPLWWRGSPPLWRPGVWVHSRGLPPIAVAGGFGWRDDWMRAPRVEREVALLVRERSSGKALYETRAVTDANHGGEAGLKALYGAALKDFPAAGLNPRSVSVPLPD